MTRKTWLIVVGALLILSVLGSLIDFPDISALTRSANAIVAFSIIFGNLYWRHLARRGWVGGFAGLGAGIGIIFVIGFLAGLLR